VPDEASFAPLQSFGLAASGGFIRGGTASSHAPTVCVEAAACVHLPHNFLDSNGHLSLGDRRKGGTQEDLIIIEMMRPATASAAADLIACPTRAPVFTAPGAAAGGSLPPGAAPLRDASMPRLSIPLADPDPCNVRFLRSPHLRALLALYELRRSALLGFSSAAEVCWGWRDMVRRRIELDTYTVFQQLTTVDGAIIAPSRGQTADMHSCAFAPV
jgi:hypothetical protein